MSVTDPGTARSHDPLSPTEDEMRKAIELGLADVEAGAPLMVMRRCVDFERLANS